jgi:site-specific recombinase XerD
LIDASKDIRQRALLAMTYGSGLRVCEVVSLKVHHIERDRHLVRVEQGKGRKDRYNLLSVKALDWLSIYWRSYRPVLCLFFGRDKSKPMDVSTAHKMYHLAKTAAGIQKGKGILTLRHFSPLICWRREPISIRLKSFWASVHRNHHGVSARPAQPDGRDQKSSGFS